METVLIETKSKQYPAFVGEGIISDLVNFIKENFPKYTKIMILTDETVANIHLHTLTNALTELEPIVHIVPSGEKAKTFDVYYQSLSFALEQKLDRRSILISFGGGAIGDLGGFVAATFMRGIPFIQVPTTILAHDSAVGGKVAINHPLGKNMIGAFYQPEAVFYDLNFLKTLPAQERRSGFAEVIKHAFISDVSFLQWLLDHVKDLNSISSADLKTALVKGIHIKGAIVAEDEKETGVRAFLNFGHTLGHAIEAETGYGKTTHGEAVAIGMLFALQLSKQIYDLQFDDQAFKTWLEQLGYKTAIPEQLSHQLLIERMKQDKKSFAQKVNFVLLKEIGEPAIIEVSEELLLGTLAQFNK